jgi:hypothetical protein
LIELSTPFFLPQVVPLFPNLQEDAIVPWTFIYGGAMNSATLFDLARTKPLETMVEHEVQKRAYELYEQRGKGTGFALQDWLEAEAEVLAKCYPPAYS